MLRALFFTMLLAMGPAFAAGPVEPRCELYLSSSTMPRRIVLMGAPGSGKSNLGRRLAKFLGVPHVSTGDMLRAEIAAGTPFGRRMESLVRSGVLAGEPEVLKHLAKMLTSQQFANGFVMEGYPRTPGAAERLDAHLNPVGRSIQQVIMIDVPEAVAVARMTGRARDGESPEIIARRLQYFREMTLPNVPHYESQGIFERIPSGGTADDTASRALRLLEERAAALEIQQFPQYYAGVEVVDLDLPIEPWFRDPVRGVIAEPHLRGVSIPVGMPSLSGKLGALARAVSARPHYFASLGFRWDVATGRLTVPLPSTFQCIQTHFYRSGFRFTPPMQARVSFITLQSWVAFITALSGV